MKLTIATAITALALAACGGPEDEAFFATAEEASAATAAAWRPFAATSPWNTPIAANPVLDPQSTASINALATSSSWPWLSVAIQQYSVPVYYVDSTRTPLVPVRVTGVAGEGFHDDSRAPIPAGALPAAGTDKHLALVDKVAHKEWDFWRAANTNGQWTCGVCASIDTNGSGVRPYPASASRQWWNSHGARACGFPLSAGLITADEIRAGRIDHALVIGYPGIRSRYFTPPASTAQGSNPRISQTSGIPCGGRVQLDPAINVDALNLSPAGKVIARALQQYGAYVGDFNGSIALYADASPDAQAYWNTGVLNSNVLRTAINLRSLRVLQVGTLYDDHN